MNFSLRRGLRFKRKQLLSDRLQSMIAAGEHAHLAVRRPVFVDDIVGIVTQLRSQFTSQWLRICIGAPIHRRQTRGFQGDVILQIFRDLKGCNDQQTEQHRVHNPVIGGGKDYHVVDLPLAMNDPAHVGMNKRNTD
jgi:hypothetical protein